MPDVPVLRFRQLPTADLSAAELGAIRRLMDEAFGADPEEAFTDDDWQHALGGMHFLLDLGGRLCSHASVVERELRVDELALRTGYVEAVATAPDRQGRGYGSRVMRAAAEFIRAEYELGALATSSVGFYERLGWQVWQGPTSVRALDGERRTPDEDGYILVLPTPRTPRIQFTAPISCDWRPGDVW